MQLRLSFVTVALILTSGAAAAALPQQGGIVAARSDLSAASDGKHAHIERAASSASIASPSSIDAESKVADAITKTNGQLDADYDKLVALQNGDPSADEATTVFSDLNTHLVQLSNDFEQISSEHQKRGLAARQDILEPAIDHLSANLNRIFPQLRLTLRHLTNKLGLNTVSIIIEQITGGLKQVNLGLEAVLKVVAQDTGKTLVDPLLRTVFALLDGLGLNLNARDVSDIAARTPSAKEQAQVEIASAATQGSANLRADTDKVNAMLDKIQVEHQNVTEDEVRVLFTSIGEHAQEATTAINAARSDLDKRADPAQPTDFEGAVVGLVKDLNILLPQLRKLVRVLVNDLQLRAVNQLVDALTPLLGSLVAAVEGLLLGLAGPLSALLNPLLDTVVALVKGLGIDLNNNTGKL